MKGCCHVIEDIKQRQSNLGKYPDFACGWCFTIPQYCLGVKAV